MKIIWLGHSGFRIESGSAVLLIDPWLTGNPMFPADRRSEAVEGATHILLTHGHGDHSCDTLAIARDHGVPVAGIYDMIQFFQSRDGVTGIGFNKGGCVDLGGVKATMVAASHSSSISGDAGSGHAGPIYAGSPVGYMLEAEGHCIYVSGDTDIMADMDWMGDLHRPDIGILSAGGHFTMDMTRAAYAARRYFRFRMVIPCHYRTFPLLEQSAAVLAAGLPGVTVVEPEVLVAVAV